MERDNAAPAFDGVCDGGNAMEDECGVCNGGNLPTNDCDACSNAQLDRYPAKRRFQVFNDANETVDCKESLWA